MNKEQNKKVFEFLKSVNGVGPVQCAWSMDYSYLAICGENRNVIIVDKRGKKIKETPLQHVGKVISLGWDKDNEFLCILQQGLTFVSLWNVFGSTALVEIDVNTGTGKEKATFASWSKIHPVLAIGTDKGGVVFYTKTTHKKVPTMGKHSKKVISGDWSKEGQGLLITGGEDKILTVSDHQGNSHAESVSVKSEPKMLSWGKIKTDAVDTQQKTVIALLNMKSILMFEIGGAIQPLELLLEAKYGDILSYSLFGDGYIVIGFSKGWVAHISTHMKEMSNAIACLSGVTNYTTRGGDHLCTNDLLYKMAAAGEGMIKFYNMSTWKEVKNERINLPTNVGRIDKMSWTPNGQILTVSTVDGHVFGFLTSQPSLSSHYGYYSTLLTSFTEITLFDCSKVGGNGITISNVNLDMEPGFIANGPNHVASGMNNIVWYYRWLDPETKTVISGGKLVHKRDYYSSVKDIKLNKDWAAVLTEGSCYLHPIEEMSQDHDRKFPSENDKPITCIALTDQFLIMLDTLGRIKYFHIEDGYLLMEYKPVVNITKFYPNANGTKLVCIDSSGTHTVFLASTEQMIPIAEFPPKTEKIIWDVTDTNRFITVEGESIQCFQITRYNLHGTLCASVKEMLTATDIFEQAPPFITKLDKGLKPMVITDGYLFSLTPAGTLQGNHLTSHSYLATYKGRNESNEGHLRYFLQNLALGRYSYSLVAASFIENNDELYESIVGALGRKCLEHLELDVAYTCYQRLQNLSMCLFIDSFKHESETNILFGNVAMIFGQYDIAQDFFLKSSKPILALEMRSDVQDWLIALNLAKTIAPEKEPLICRRLATQIESQGNPAEALRLYEKAMLSADNEGLLDRQSIESHNLQCLSGVARTSIKLGDVSRGFNIASELKDSQQIIEIAMVCENAKHALEAGQLYEKAGLYEKAASIYISLKLFKQATPLISKIKSPKLLMQLAKTKEAEGSYKEAESAYEKAEDWENVIRINLSFLDDAEKAKWILRNKCPTQTCAKMLASYCEKKGTKAEAIEFLVMAGRKEEAFVLAQSHNEMESYAEHVTDLSSEEALRIAQYFEGKSQYGKAAIYYERSGNTQRALKLFIQGGEEYLEKAIELVARAKQDVLTLKLRDYLMGEAENPTPQDPIWVFKMYMALGNVRQASSIAITIANQEQESGNYKGAHGILFQTLKDLKGTNTAVPYDLEQKLMILHSYISVKRLVKMNEHVDAARLLDRVCKNISQFPAHDVTILTSTVVQATRANLKATAFHWAKVLMQNEYRNKIAESYKKKIETVARRPITEEGVEHIKTKCPFCENMVEEFVLTCERCDSAIPFCIVTGKHITPDDCTFDPRTGFPAIYSSYLKALELERVSPMNGEPVDPEELHLASMEEIRQKIIKKKVEEKPDGDQVEPSTADEDSKIDY